MTLDLKLEAVSLVFIFNHVVKNIEDFEKLSQEEQTPLLTAAGVTTKVTGGSGGGTYLVPVSMSKTSERNKIDAGHKIDPSLNKDEIIRIISK